MIRAGIDLVTGIHATAKLDIPQLPGMAGCEKWLRVVKEAILAATWVEDPREMMRWVEESKGTPSDLNAACDFIRGPSQFRGIDYRLGQALKARVAESSSQKPDSSIRRQVGLGPRLATKWPPQPLIKS